MKLGKNPTKKQLGWTCEEREGLVAGIARMREQCHILSVTLAAIVKKYGQEDGILLDTSDLEEGEAAVATGTISMDKSNLGSGFWVRWLETPVPEGET